MWASMSLLGKGNVADYKVGALVFDSGESSSAQLVSARNES